MTLVPGSAIPMSTNSAYKMIEKKPQNLAELPASAEDEENYDVPFPPSHPTLPSIPLSSGLEEAEDVYEVLPGEEK